MVNWSFPAKNDLRRIYDYIANDSKFYAKRLVETIVEKTEILDKFSKVGRVVPEIEDDNIREIFIYSYRVIYEISSTNIEILAVIHGRRDFPSMRFDDL